MVLKFKTGQEVSKEGQGQELQDSLLEVQGQELQEVSKEECDYVVDLLKRTMPHANIRTVSYLGNRTQKQQYLRRRASMELSCDLNETLMFRGTWRTPTKDIAEYGYVKTSGRWGHGWYFSDSARYAARYAYENTNRTESTSEKELTLALLITGDSYKYNSDNHNAFNKHPKNAITERRYHSCLGNKTSHLEKITGYCCVVFNSDQIYPLYSITYSESVESLSCL